MNQTLGDGPIDPRYIKKMKAMASALDDFLNEGQQERRIGFVVIMFEFGEGPGRANYISNAQRSDVVTLLKEQIARFEGQPEIKGSA
jgi:hypothetical protein